MYSLPAESAAAAAEFDDATLDAAAAAVIAAATLPQEQLPPATAAAAAAVAAATAAAECDEATLDAAAAAVIAATASMAAEEFFGPEEVFLLDPLPGSAQFLPKAPSALAPVAGATAASDGAARDGHPLQLQAAQWGYPQVMTYLWHRLQWERNLCAGMVAAEEEEEVVAAGAGECGGAVGEETAGSCGLGLPWEEGPGVKKEGEGSEAERHRSGAERDLGSPTKRQKRRQGQQSHAELLQRYDEFISDAKKLCQAATHGPPTFRGFGGAKKRAALVRSLPKKIAEFVITLCDGPLLREPSGRQLLHVLKRCPTLLRDSLADQKLAEKLAQQCRVRHDT